MEITPEYLRQQTGGAKPQKLVSKQNVDEFFRAAVSTPTWKLGAELETARRYQSLVQLLKDYLTEFVVYRVGGDCDYRLYSWQICQVFLPILGHSFVRNEPISY